MTEKLEITLRVASEAPALECRRAWPEIATERFERLDAMDHCTDANLDHTGPALRTLETAIRERPSTVQKGHLMYIDAGVCNGSDSPFDLADLRALDTELGKAGLEDLHYDRLGAREVHHHLAGGDRERHPWFRDYGIEPALRLGERQAEAFAVLPQKTDRDRDSLLDEAIDERAAKDRRKASAGPKTSAPKR